MTKRVPPRWQRLGFASEEEMKMPTKKHSLRKIYNTDPTYELYRHNQNIVDLVV